MDNPSENLSTVTHYWKRLREKGFQAIQQKAALILRGLPRRSGAVAQLLHCWSPPSTPDSDIEAFASFVVEEPATGCWIFVGPDLYSTDYPSFPIPSTGRWEAAHRWVYLLLHGPLPEDLVIDHRCEVPPCANPDHLQAVTPSDNRKLRDIRYRLSVEQAVRADCRP